MPRISVGVTAELASALLDAETGEASRLERQLKQLEETGAALTPQGPRHTADQALALDEVVWFSVEAADDRAAAELTHHLLQVEGVLSAYSVPPEGPP